MNHGQLARGLAEANARLSLALSEMETELEQVTRERDEALAQLAKTKSSTA